MMDYQIIFYNEVIKFYIINRVHYVSWEVSSLMCRMCINKFMI
jgi:hypothetical protein